MEQEKRKERYRFKNTGGNSYQFPRTGAGHPESRFRASPRILEPGQISRSRYRHAESNLRTSPCDLEIERQNTDSKFRDSSFCLRSCTLTSSIAGTHAKPLNIKSGCASNSFEIPLNLKRDSWYGTPAIPLSLEC